MTIGLKNVRKRRGLSIEALSIRTGVNKSSLKKYESGERDIKKASYETLELLSSFLNVPIEALVREEEDLF